MENIFIEAIKIVKDKPGMRISYNEIIAELEKRKLLTESIDRNYIKTWFFSSFYTDLLPLIKYQNGEILESEFKRLQDKQATLTYEVYITYLDYTELQEARQSSRDAMKIAKYSIWISAILAVASIIIGIIQICNCK